MQVLTPAQMREADRAASARVGESALMRTAGERIAEAVQRYAREGRVVAFAGPGNNGGDAFATLAALPASFERIAYAQDAQRNSPARDQALSRAQAAGVQIRSFPPDRRGADDAVRAAAIILDGLVGTGARLPLPQTYTATIAAMNDSSACVIAIDVPSGIDAERGTAGDPAVRARATVTLAALKPGLLLPPGSSHAGELWLADIGMAQEIAGIKATHSALDDEEFLRLLPHRAASSDKRSAGAPLIVAGSEQFPGAAVLCAMSAARTGAGYVTVATSARAAPALRAHLLEQVVVTLDDAAAPARVVEELLEVAKRCSSIGIGPGLPLDDRTGEIVRGFASRVPLPIVADASALFHFAKQLDLLRGKPIVLTPHAGEFARLSGKGTVRERDRVERLREFVDRTGVTTLLKGEATLVYDGATMHINPSGTAALATAGTGDVLTGIIATLLSQGLTPVDAARAAAYWHGLAGQVAERKRKVGVIARDVYESLAEAMPRDAKVPLLMRIGKLHQERGSS